MVSRIIINNNELLLYLYKSFLHLLLLRTRAITDKWITQLIYHLLSLIKQNYTIKWESHNGGKK